MNTKESSPKVGDKVYLPHLQKEGIVVLLNSEGKPEVVNVDGKFVNVLNKVVELIPKVLSILQLILSLFRKKR